MRLPWYDNIILYKTKKGRTGRDWFNFSWNYFFFHLLPSHWPPLLDCCFRRCILSFYCSLWSNDALLYSLAPTSIVATKQVLHARVLYPNNWSGYFCLSRCSLGIDSRRARNHLLGHLWILGRNDFIFDQRNQIAIFGFGVKYFNGEQGDFFW